MASIPCVEPAAIAFDVGNSAVKCAVLCGEQWYLAARARTKPIQTLADRLRGTLAKALPALTAQTRCLVSSVCPPADGQIRELCEALAPPSGPQFFGRDIPIPMETLLKRPEMAGSDRLLCALGARRIAGAPCIVVGLGTAITVDRVDEKGRFAGGAIAPGLALAARSLHEGTACLPEVQPQRPPRATGTDTVEAIQSGIHWLCRGGVAEIIRQLRAEQSRKDTPVVVTGGDAEVLLPLPVTGQVQHEPNLIFIGMATALDMPPGIPPNGP